jgi:hypothetical protein
MNEQMLQIMASFGPAGLIGLLWIAERRHAARRDRQLAEAHRTLMDKDHALDAMINVVRDNTRAIVSLEHTQRQLIELASHLGVAGSKR